jgi:hypothetical protein
VLHHDRHARFDDRGEVGIARHRAGIGKVVEAQMQRATRAD